MLFFCHSEELYEVKRRGNLCTGIHDEIAARAAYVRNNTTWLMAYTFFCHSEELYEVKRRGNLCTGIHDEIAARATYVRNDTTWLMKILYMPFVII